MSQLLPALNPVEIFLKSWQVYQDIIKHNYMFHRELSETTQNALERIKPDTSLKILDLGCGDASMALPLLAKDRIELYTGCDLSQPALDIARSRLEKKDIPHRLVCEDMVAVASEQPDTSVDVVFSSYALHHLNAIDKERLLRDIARILAPGGAFMLIDIFRDPGEDRVAYIDNYMGSLRRDWHLLTEDAQCLVINHATEFDYPEPPEFYSTRCLKFGLNNGHLLSKHTWHEAWIFTN